jgi:hypothetical protein
MSIDTTEPIGQVFYAADGGDDETGAGYYMKACVHWFGKAPAADTMLYTTPQPAQVTQAEVTDEREAFEACEVMAGSLFKRRADDPENIGTAMCKMTGNYGKPAPSSPGAPVAVPMTDEQPYPYSPEPKRRMLPGRYIIRKNDDGEFGQATGWLYRDEGPDCLASGAPIYVWRPLSDLIGQKPSAEPMNREAVWDASPTNSDCEAVDAYMQGIADAEAHQGITAQAKKETP